MSNINDLHYQPDAIIHSVQVASSWLIVTPSHWQPTPSRQAVMKARNTSNL